MTYAHRPAELVQLVAVVEIGLTRAQAEPLDDTAGTHARAELRGEFGSTVLGG